MENGFNIGDDVLVLMEYNLVPAKILKVNKKKIKVETKPGFGHTAQIKCFLPEKVVHFNEQIVFVWETWRGVNGRGAYRIEKNLYPSKQKAAKLWFSPNHVREISHGII